MGTIKVATAYRTFSIAILFACLALSIVTFVCKTREIEDETATSDETGKSAVVFAAELLSTYIHGCHGQSANWSTRYLQRRLPTAGSYIGGTPYTPGAYFDGETTTSVAQDWLDIALGETVPKPVCGPVREVDVTLIFDSTSASPTLGYLAVQQNSDGHLSVWRRISTDPATSASKFSATASTSNTTAVIDYSSATSVKEVEADAAACLTSGACSGGVTSGVTALLAITNNSGGVEAEVHTAMEYTTTATSGTTTIRSSVRVSTQNLMKFIANQIAPSTATEIFVFDSSGYLVATSRMVVEETRLSDCVASATTTAEQLACAVISGAAHPDSEIRVAATAFSLSTLIGESSVEVESTDYFATTIDVPGVFPNYRLIVISRKPYVTKSQLIASGLVSLFLLLAEVVIFTLSFWKGKSEVTIPFELLAESMRSVMRLDFNDLEDDRGALNDLMIDELESLQRRFFDMADYVKCFANYVPKEVIRELQETGTLHSRIMTNKILTCVMVDIANFTTMCEAVTTDDLGEMAEKYYNVATRTLAIHGCTIDKFIGDAIMGFWGAPLDYTLQGFSACCGALHLTTVVQRLQPFFAKFDQALSVRIGLSRGPALVGNIGCDDRIGYTALGSTVLMAEALEGLNKVHQSDIIISESVLEDAERHHAGLFLTRRLGTVTLADVADSIAPGKSGKTQPVYQLLGLRKKEIIKALAKVGKGDRKKRRQQLKSNALDSTSMISNQGTEKDMELQSIGSHSHHGGSHAGSTVPATSSHVGEHKSDRRRRGTKRKNHPSPNGSTTSSAQYEGAALVNSSQQHLALMGEKFALLTEEEEISNIRDNVCFSPAECNTVQKVTNAVSAYEGGRFDEAAAMLAGVLGEEREHLALVGVAIPPLEKTLKLYEKYSRIRPTQNQFNNGVIKL